MGGGPAGLAAAIALQHDGYQVTVVDCSAPPLDKACGEGLMPDSLAALNELGVQIPPDAGFAFYGIRFAERGRSVSGDFPQGCGRGLRRTVLHPLLLKRARKMGVSLIWNAKHVRLANGGVAVDGQLIEAPLVVGADGQNSQIRRQAALHRVRHEKRRYGFRRHYKLAPWTPYVELHWGANAQIYITPVASDEICVATVSRDPHARLSQVLPAFPDLNRRLSQAPAVSLERGALSVSRSLHRVQRDGVVLIGDASGSVDAITGEGMGLAFKQALALSAALRADNIHAYESSHRALMRRPQIMGALLLMLEAHPQLRGGVMKSLTAHPEVFEGLLAIHVGACSVRDVCSRAGRYALGSLCGRSRIAQQ